MHLSLHIIMCLSLQAEKDEAFATAAKQNSTDIIEGSYVTVAPGYKGVSDAAGGPLEPGRFGIVKRDDKSSKPFEVSRS